MTPIFICLVAWDNGSEPSHQTRESATTKMTRVRERGHALQEARSSVVGSIAAAFAPLFSRAPARARHHD